MIENFEDITEDLTEEEKKYIPWILKGLIKKVGPDQAVKTDAICRGLNALNEQKQFAACVMNPARLRKCINHIRRNGLLNFVIGTSKGYYVTGDHAVVLKEIRSLDQRSEAIKAVADSMRMHLSALHSSKQSTLNL